MVGLMSRVTVIGMGPMGSKMAETFLAAGHEVTVWNRTKSKTDPLVASGARRADEAAEGELLVISQVSYQAMYDSLGEARLDGKVLVNLSSGTPEELRAAAGWVAGRGGTLDHRRDHGAAARHRAAHGVHLLQRPEGGRRPARRDAQGVGHDHLRGRGPGPGDDVLPGAAADLLVQPDQLHARARAARHGGGAARDFLPFARETFTQLGGDGPMGFAKILAEEAEARVYPGELNSLHMQAVGIGHAVHALKDAGLETTVPNALKELFERADAEGRGSEGLGTVIESIRKP